MVKQVAYLLVGLTTALSIVGPGYASRYGAVLLAGLAVIALAGGARLRRGDVLAVVIVTWALASQFWAVDQETALGSWKDLVGGATIFVAIRLVLDTPAAMRTALLAYLAGCVWAVYRLTQRDAAESGFTLPESATRATLEGVNANHLAYALSVGVILVPLLWMTKRPALLGRLCSYGLVAAIYLLGITQTGTRGAVVALAGFVVWWVLWRMKAVRSPRIPWLVFLAAQVVVVLGLLDERVRPFLTESARETGTLNGRLDFWPAARAVFNDNIFFGVGLDGFIARNGGSAAHNVSLDLGSGLGLVGLVLSGLWLHQVLMVETRAAEPRRRALIVGGFIVAMTPILTSGYWHQSSTFWAAVALVSLLPVAAPGLAGADPLKARRTRVPRRDAELERLRETVGRHRAVAP